MKTTIKTILLLAMSAGMAVAGQQADRIKSQQEAWKKSVAAERGRNYDLAITALSDYSKNKGDRYNASIRLGWLYYLKKNYAGAEKYYQLAARYSQGSVSPLLGLVNTYKASKQNKKAIRACKSVLVLDKSNYIINMTLAGLLYAEKDYRGSGVVYGKVNKLYPEDLDAMSGLGWCLFYENRKSKALPIFTRLMVMSPNYPYAKKGYELCGGKK